MNYLLQNKDIQKGLELFQNNPDILEKYLNTGEMHNKYINELYYFNKAVLSIFRSQHKETTNSLFDLATENEYMNQFLLKIINSFINDCQNSKPPQSYQDLSQYLFFYNLKHPYIKKHLTISNQTIYSSLIDSKNNLKNLPPYLYIAFYKSKIVPHINNLYELSSNYYSNTKSHLNELIDVLIFSHEDQCLETILEKINFIRLTDSTLKNIKTEKLINEIIKDEKYPQHLSNKILSILKNEEKLYSFTDQIFNIKLNIEAITAYRNQNNLSAFSDFISTIYYSFLEAKKQNIDFFCDYIDMSNEIENIKSLTSGVYKSNLTERSPAIAYVLGTISFTYKDSSDLNIKKNLLETFIKETIPMKTLNVENAISLIKKLVFSQTLTQKTEHIIDNQIKPITKKI